MDGLETHYKALHDEFNKLTKDYYLVKTINSLRKIDVMIDINNRQSNIIDFLNKHEKLSDRNYKRYMLAEQPITLLNVGDKVSYVEHIDGTIVGTISQHGKIKSYYNKDINKIYVVFDCADNWDKYQDYTAQLTDIKQLKIGWL